MSTFDSTRRSLGELLKDIVAGKTQLPDFQRGWVWDDEHIQSLLVSIARSFPVGAVMLLENGGETRFKMRPVEGVDSASVSNVVVEKLILDGQQRLTSLTQVLMLEKPVQTRDSKKRDMERLYYIDIAKALEGPEYYQDAFFGVEKDKTVRENFGRDIKIDLRTPELEYQNFCFPCNQILSPFSWLHGLSQSQPEKLKRFLDFQKIVIGAFESYQIPIISLAKETSKEAVCLVFEKVNTGGVPLSVFELITATYAADGVNLRDEWFGNKKENVEGVHPYLSRQKMLASIEPTDFFQGISILHTYAMRKQDLAAGKVGKQATGVSAKRETVLSLPLSVYQRWKEPLRNGFWMAAKFLRRESFFTPSDLPYRTQLVPLAAILALLGERWQEQRICEKLARWYWSGVLGELYGGAVETRIALDLQEFMAWLEDDALLPATVRDANFQPQRLDTLRSRNSAAYKGINVLIQRQGAQDWFWKSTIRDLSETDWEDNRLDVHHIFPKDWCEKRGIPPRRYNSILNKTPISYKANRMIGGKAPSDYLVQLQNHASVLLAEQGMDILLKTHLLDTVSLRANNFDAFIEARRELMVKLISETMGKALIVTNETVPEDDDDEDGLHSAVVSSSDVEREDELDERDDDEDDDLDAVKREQVQSVLIPALQRLSISYRLRKNGKGITAKLGLYRVSIGARRAGKFKLYIYSAEQSREQALLDFPNAEPFYPRNTEKDSQTVAMMKARPIEDLLAVLEHYRSSNQ